jgi:tetratricopeptide (TPR) repeat protein
VEEELLRAHPVVAGLAVARVAANLQDYPQAERLAGLLAGSDRDRATRAGAHILTALMRFAQGKWSGGMEALATASRFDPAWAMELRALFTGFPLRSLSIQEASQLRDELLEWDGTEQGPSSGYPLFAHNGYHPLLRLYLLSLASIWMGDTEAAWDFAAELEREPRGPDRQQVASRWAASLRGRIAEAEGRREEAMGRLEEVRLEVPLELIAISPFFSRSLDRYRLGRLLAEHGREAEGLSWLGTLTEGYELVLAAPAHFEMGQILWGLEDREGAEEHYRRFVELWADCDEEFRPLIGVARDRLAALTDTAGGPGG